MKSWQKALIAAAVVLAILFGVLRVTYNGLVDYQEAVSTAEANVEIYLQRRAELIPNLVNTVKGLSAHELSVIDKVTSARENLMNAQGISEIAEADAQLTRAIGDIKVIVENYPEISSDSAYLSLMDELAGSENRVATAWGDYNEAAQTYNKIIKKFPTNILAAMVGMHPADYFKADPGMKENPTVRFD